MKTTKLIGRAASAAVLAGSLAACSDFISGAGGNTNLLPDASAAQLFTGIQVNTFFWNENQISRITAMWLNQAAGTDRQFSLIDQYVYDEEDADGEMSSLYGATGLRDIRIAEAKTDSVGFQTFNAVLKIHEAFLFGEAASIFGDLPYSTALDPANLATLDKQEAVYAAVQTLLSQAITQMVPAAQAAEAGQLSARDLNFGGNQARWRAVAHSLKARFYMHWVEAQAAGGAAATAANTACGGNCLTKALAEAQLGIQTSAGNWRDIRTATATETNLWYQFNSDRSGYISGGKLLIDMLKANSDPRLPLYFTVSSNGTYRGSPPGTIAGDPGQASSQINTTATGYADAGADLPIITCAETYFIVAEAQYRLGNEAAANTALQSGIACHETQLGLATNSIPRPAALTGAALLAEIIRQKYIVLYLNMEAFNDYKRTCLPSLTTVKAGTNIANVHVPGRLYYSQTERLANSNIPAPGTGANGDYNTNDPVHCTAAGA
jgi:hypothetical protein